mmetsp:Transcript_119485/g.385770  ORF Transcript_119485/g.385770 Transcript_119485/m.385770 type:complete len:214 (+) Transcript_119485:100-741(+)
MASSQPHCSCGSSCTQLPSTHPPHVMLKCSFAVLQRCGVVMLSQLMPTNETQLLPPHPHAKPRCCCAPLQMPGTEMLPHCAVAWLIQPVPLQPAARMLPDFVRTDSQRCRSVIRLASAPCSRQLLPPQPQQFKFSRCLAFLQMLCVVMLPQLAVSLVRQLLPPQPTDSRPNFAFDHLHKFGIVMRSAVASGPRQLLPPQPLDSMPNMSLECLQ